MSDQDEKKKGEWVYENGALKANQKTVQVFSRTYNLKRIERIGIRRDPLYFAIGILLPLVFFAFKFNPYLYDHERLIIFGGCAGILFFLYRFGILYIQAGGAYAPAAVWKLKELTEFRDQIRRLLSEMAD